MKSYDPSGNGMFTEKDRTGPFFSPSLSSRTFLTLLLCEPGHCHTFNNLVDYVGHHNNNISGISTILTLLEVYSRLWESNAMETPIENYR